MLGLVVDEIDGLSLDTGRVLRVHLPHHGVVVVKTRARRQEAIGVRQYSGDDDHGADEPRHERHPRRPIRRSFAICDRCMMSSLRSSCRMRNGIDTLRARAPFPPQNRCRRGVKPRADAVGGPEILEIEIRSAGLDLAGIDEERHVEHPPRNPSVLGAQEHGVPIPEPPVGIATQRRAAPKAGKQEVRDLLAALQVGRREPGRAAR